MVAITGILKRCWWQHKNASIAPQLLLPKTRTIWKIRIARVQLKLRCSLKKLLLKFFGWNYLWSVILKLFSRICHDQCLLIILSRCRTPLTLCFQKNNVFSDKVEYIVARIVLKLRFLRLGLLLLVPPAVSSVEQRRTATSSSSTYPIEVRYIPYIPISIFKPSCGVFHNAAVPFLAHY